MSKITAAISGIHCYVPEDILSNRDLESMVETTDEWITSRTGIKERRILKGKDKGTSVLGIGAVKGLLDKTNTRPEDVDMLICSTVTPDMLFPATANVISHHTGLTNAFGYDMNAACSGFIYALVTGAQFIETGKYKKIIVVGADKMSSIVDYTDRATCIIFGDAAGAVLLEPNSEGFGVIDSILKSDGSGEQFLHMKAGGSRRPPSHETIDAREHYVYQEGSSVFKFAVSNMADVSEELAKKHNLNADTIDWLVPHQANLRIIDATARRLGVNHDKVMIVIEKYGNTTNATIPLALWEYETRLKKGDNVMLAAFGGGFTWGSVYVKWALDTA
jgi:3-oxoacyl-[acyl-carrier-protein] synthase III